MNIENRYHGWDSHLEKWKNRLSGRSIRQGEDTQDGLIITWTKQDILDFTNWTEGNYSKRPWKERKKRLNNMGVSLLNFTGSGGTTTTNVKIHNFTWYNLLLRGKAFRNNVAEAYMKELFTGNGFMELDGVFLSATIREYAEKYGGMFGETVSAARNKLDRIRKHLTEYDYLLKGKQSLVKQIRVKLAEQDTYLKGPSAIYLNNALRTEYVKFYDELNKRLPLQDNDPLLFRIQRSRLRKDETINFTEQLKVKYKLALIRSHRTAVVSEKALSDYQAIITLYIMGATFTEIRSFLDERPAYWKDEERRQKTPGKNINEILDEVL
jgi:hypothetical protein